MLESDLLGDLVICAPVVSFEAAEQGCLDGLPKKASVSIAAMAIVRVLGEDLAMEDLARVAHFSLWHFHRVFAAVAMSGLKFRAVAT